MMQGIQGKLINGEIYLSISIIKNILYQDVIMEEERMSKKEYILNLIERFNNIKIER